MPVSNPIGGGGSGGSSGPLTSVNALGSLGATKTLGDPSTYGMQRGTLTANTAITVPAAVVGASFTLKLNQDATGGRTPSFIPTGADQLVSPAGAVTWLTDGDDENLLAFSCDTAGVWDIVAITGGAAGSPSALLPTGAKAETFPRNAATAASSTAIGSGTLYLVAVDLEAGEDIDTITFLSGSAGAVTPTHQWFGLFDSARTALRLTADALTAPWAANTEKPLALTSTFTTTYKGRHYLGIMVEAATVPNQVAVVGSGTLNGIAPVIAMFSTASLTTPVAEGTVVTAGAARGQIPYAYVS